MEDKIKEVLDKIRPALVADGGDLEFVSFDQESGVLEVRFLGACAGCQMAKVTLKQGVEKAVVAEVPGVTEVRLAA
jgi:Fe-S cluster biogenesis protein NfuA